MQAIGARRQMGLRFRRHTRPPDWSCPSGPDGFGGAFQAAPGQAASGALTSLERVWLLRAVLLAAAGAPTTCNSGRLRRAPPFFAERGQHTRRRV